MATVRELEQQANQITQDVKDLNSKMVGLKESDAIQQEQIQALTTAADRLSIAVLGDVGLGIKGLVKTVDELKSESLTNRMTKAKWAGAGMALAAATKLVWEIVTRLLSS